MKQPIAPAPVVLTGRVYVHGALADEFPSQRCPAKPSPGILRIHAHLDQSGRERRARGHTAAGYSGVIRASLFDGKAWRKFMLARETQVDQRTFAQFSHRRDTARSVLRVLGLLKGKTCIYRDGAFAVDHEVARVELSPPAASTTATTPGPATVVPPPLQPRVAQVRDKVLQQGTLWPDLAVTATATKPRCKRKRRRRARRRSTSANQPTLF